MNPEIEQLFSNKGTSSGYDLLDKEIGGWQNGDLIIIGSRPAVGKTAFAINIALNAAAGMNIPVLFFTLEMSSESLVKRMIIREAEINIKDIDGKHIIEKDVVGNLQEGVCVPQIIQKYQNKLEKECCLNCPLYPACVLLENCPTMADFASYRCEWYKKNLGESIVWIWNEKNQIRKIEKKKEIMC